MQARSALFDLYGDHLRRRGGQAPVAALIRLLAPLGVAAPAVRTAISRMVRQGWLVPTRAGGGAGYRLTGRAALRLEEAGARIYRTERLAWDGRFDLVLVTNPTTRQERERLAANTLGGRAGESDETRWRATEQEVRNAQSQWARLGPVLADVAGPLNERFQRAVRKFYDQRKRASERQASGCRLQASDVLRPIWLDGRSSSGDSVRAGPSVNTPHRPRLLAGGVCAGVTRRRPGAVYLQL
jgi:hypothetical protein